MQIRTTFSLTEARKRIFDIAEEVQSPGVYYTFTEKGQPKAVLLSAEEFESWAETLEVIQDFPELKKDVDEARKDYKSGKLITLNNYVQGKSLSKSRKRSR